MTEQEGGFRRQLDRVEGLVRALEGCPDLSARDAARELVRALLDLHAAGLARVLDLVQEGGARLIDHLARDPLVSSLLLLHGLHPTPVEARVADALGRLRPRLRARGGDVEVLTAGSELVRVRVRGDRASGPELRLMIEAALTEAAPDAAAVEFEEAWEGSPTARLPLPLAQTGP